MTRKMITAMLCALLCLPMVAGAASTPISQTPDAGTLTGAEKIPIGRVGGTTAISTTTGALLNRANHTGTQAATTVAEDSTHRFATDAEKSAWNAKQAAYSVLTTLGGLSHASGWLKNDGAGALSYATPTKADVGLGNVDNTSDANKPVSTAVQTALNAKAPLAAPTFTDSVTAPSFNSTAADGYHYIRPYNSVAFAGTALAGMFVTTPTGPQWYNGSAWEAIGSGGGGTWGSITGTLSAQTDLQAALDAISAGGITMSVGIPTDPGAAYLNDSTHVLTVASTTGYTQFTGSYTAWDTTPAAFAFTDLTDVALSTTQTATPVQVTDINYPTAVTATGGTAAICTGATVGTCGTFSASPGNVALNQYVSAQHASSGSNSTAVNTVVTIGGVSDTFTSTTAAGGGPAFSDNFSTDSSANYATIGTESLNGITVASGYAVAKNRWATNNVIRGIAGSASHYAQAKIQYHAVDASGLIVGASDAGSTTTTGYQVIPSSTTLIKLRSISGNTVTNRGEWTVPEMTVDTYYTVKIVKSGSTFAMYLNGTHITPDVTDTTYTDGQYIGLSFDCSNGVFSPADDFEGGL